MKQTILLSALISLSLALFCQNQICVDGSASGEENGTPSNPYHTIQEAVNNASNGDTIKVAKGTYIEAVQISQKKMQLLGGFSGNGDFNNANPQANPTIINGTTAAPCIWVNIDAQVISGSLTISGFTIANGKRGIELTGGWSEKLDNITIENNIIENNGLEGDGQRGGGIGLEGNNVTIKNNIIRSNQSWRGAAIGTTGNAPRNFLIANNIIENNTGHSDHAGGVYICGSGSITHNLFDGNVAAASESYGWGGGIVIFNYDTTKLITLSYNVWRNNYAPLRGGAVFVDEAAKVSMEHELLYNNKSKESGSAIYVDADWEKNSSVLYMDNCTVSENASDTPDGAALFVQESITHIQNCIFWNNVKDFEFYAGGASNAKLTANYTLSEQGFTGTGNLSVDPLFADAPNGDFHLKSTKGRYDPATGLFVNDNVSSPAIDAGNPASDFSQEPLPNGERVNLGCYGNTPEASKTPNSGVDDNKNATWTLFPNPAVKTVTISSLPVGSRVIISDITGRIIYTSESDNKSLTICTENLYTGIYLVQVSNKGCVTHRKLVVSK